MIELPLTKPAKIATQLVRELHTHGFEAYFAGGSVRDLLLGRVPKDYDIVTAAKPEEIEQIFPKTIPVGRKFGIVMVIQDSNQFEIATFRTEGKYSDRRRPDHVTWATAAEDAKRRDFTINALYYDPIHEKLLDFVGGQLDLQEKIIRFVGNPQERVAEDHLRILRAVRLKNTLGFQYDRDTYQAIKQDAPSIGHISNERIRDELNLILHDPSRATALNELSELGLLEVVLPEIETLRGVPQPLEYHREGDVFDHTLATVASMPKRSPAFLVWAVLLHDVGKATTLRYPDHLGGRIRFDGHKTLGARIARQIGVRLRLPRTEISTIAWLVDHHMDLKGIEKMREAKRRTYLLDPRFKWLLEVHRADALGTNPPSLSLYREIRAFHQKYLTLWKTEQQSAKFVPLITGHDLQNELGLKPGRDLGILLAQLKDAQLERTIVSRDEALTLAKNLLKR